MTVTNNNVLNAISKILFGFLTFCLSFIGYIFYFALKKNYPEQAKSCLIGSTIGTAVVVLTVVLFFILPEDFDDNIERISTAKTEITPETSVIKESEKQQDTNRKVRTEEELYELLTIIVTVIIVVFLLGLFILAIKKFGIAKIFGFFVALAGQGGSSGGHSRSYGGQGSSKSQHYHCSSCGMRTSVSQGRGKPTPGYCSGRDEMSNGGRRPHTWVCDD